MGFFYRTIRIVENGIKPAYVFDGKPPDLKSGVVRISFEAERKRTDYDDNSSQNDLKKGRRQKRTTRKLKKQVGTVNFG